MTRRCTYCLGMFDGRADAETCCAACRKAWSTAPSLDDVSLRPAFRRETHSMERARATGFGLMTPTESYHADLRARVAAGVEVPVLPPFGPGFGTGDVQFEVWNAAQRRAS